MMDDLGDVWGGNATLVASGRTKVLLPKAILV